jgi:Co/Zn/Cd efflux system component
MAWMEPIDGHSGGYDDLAPVIWAARLTSAVLLDRQKTRHIWEVVKDSIERHGDKRGADLHIWSVGPDIYAAIVSVINQAPRSPDWYKTLVPDGLGLVHVTVEVHCCPDKN